MGNKKNQIGIFVELGKDATEADIQNAKRDLAQRMAEQIIEEDAFIVKSPDDYARINEEESFLGFSPLPRQWTVGLKVDIG